MDPVGVGELRSYLTTFHKPLLEEVFAISLDRRNKQLAYLAASDGPEKDRLKQNLIEAWHREDAAIEKINVIAVSANVIKSPGH